MPNHFSNAQAPAPARRPRRLWIIPVVIVAVLAVAYLGGVAAFSYMYLPGTTLDGADVSLRKVSDVAAQKSGTFDGFETRVTGDGLDLTVTAGDIDLSYDGEAYAQSALSQTNPWAWPLELAQTRTLTADAGADFDRDKLVALIQPTVDASAGVASELGSEGITFDAAAGTYALDERVVASHLDVDAVVSRLEEAFAAHESEVELGDESLQGGSALYDAVSQANSYVAATQSLTLAGTEAYLLDAPTIAQWVTIGDDLSVTLDTQAINDFCHGALTDALDTVGTERTYTRPDGSQKTVADTMVGTYGKSTYGWIIDGDACADQIVAAIQGGTAGSIELPCIQSAAAWAPGGQDWGSRYIDVDITAQHATFYDNGSVIWQADITTGQPSLGNDTPTGVWKVTNRKSRATDGDINLEGPIDPETNEPEWDSHVDFWAGFVGNLVGFHNAPWQSVFGGQIYTWNGSHGCIRLSYADGEALYNVVQVGDTVVVHK